MLIECTKLLTGAPQARRFAAMCASGFGHRAQYSFSEASLVTLRVSDEAAIGIGTKGGLGHQRSLENHGTDNSMSHAGSGSGCERSVRYLFDVVVLRTTRNAIATKSVDARGGWGLGVGCA